MEKESFGQEPKNNADKTSERSELKFGQKEYQHLSPEEVENIYSSEKGREIGEGFARSCSILVEAMGLKKNEFTIEILGDNECAVEMEAPEDKNEDVVGKKVKMIIKRDIKSVPTHHHNKEGKYIGTSLHFGDLSVKFGEEELRIDENTLLQLYSMRRKRHYSKFIRGLGIGRE